MQENYPILGMFRDNIRELSHDLAIFLHSIIQGDGVTLQDNEGKEYVAIKIKEYTALTRPLVNEIKNLKLEIEQLKKELNQ